MWNRVGQQTDQPAAGKAVDRFEIAAGDNGAARINVEIGDPVVSGKSDIESGVERAVGFDAGDASASNTVERGKISRHDNARVRKNGEVDVRIYVTGDFDGEHDRGKGRIEAAVCVEANQADELIWVSG